MFSISSYKSLNGTAAAPGSWDSRPDEYKVRLADGASVGVYDSNGNCNDDFSMNASAPLNKSCGSVDIDINGDKGPNQFGRDMFSWHITNLGVYPVGIQNDTSYGCDPTSSDVTYDANGAPGFGAGCTAKVIQDGKIDY